MGSLDMDLGKIQEAADMDMSVIAEEGAAARVRSARQSEAEHAFKTDDAAKLLNTLFSEDAEAEVAERKRRKREAAERKKAEEEARSEKEKLEAEKRIQDENRRIEEMKARKEKMLADLAKQRRIEEVGYDEEEVARQKAEEEARQRAEEEAEKREEAEMSRQIAEMKANQAELDAKNRANELKRQEEERQKARKRTTITAIAAAAILIIAGATGYYFATLKAPDFYVLTENYATKTIALQSIPSAGMTTNAYAFNEVKQEDPNKNKQRPSGTRTNSNKNPNDIYGIGNVKNVLGGNTLVK